MMRAVLLLEPRTATSSILSKTSNHHRVITPSCLAEPQGSCYYFLKSAMSDHQHDVNEKLVRPKTFDRLLEPDYSARTLIGGSTGAVSKLEQPPVKTNQQSVLVPVSVPSSLQRQNPSPKPLGYDIQVVASVPVTSDPNLLQEQDSVLECLGPLLGEPRTAVAPNKRPRTTRTADQHSRKMQEYPHSKRRRLSSGSSTSTSKKEEDEQGTKNKKEIGLTDHQAALWENRFKELAGFQQSFGHSLVPHKWSENLALATWVKRQRYQWKLREQGKRSTLTQERNDSLSELGFVWDSHNAIWEERFNELVEYKRVQGHTSVPSTDKNHSLSVWVQCQRRQWKLMKDEPVDSNDTPGYRIKQTRIEKLDALRFIWEPRKQNQQEEEGEMVDENYS
jgi:hypothetical protein